ncbi:MAG: carbohydrate kinase family protein [Gammaproteobacteria bacterium]|nr:carbohydrate kinase family protein [Gammaproteobacteria bacterium]
MVLVSGSVSYDILINADCSFSQLIDNRSVKSLSVGYPVRSLSIGFGGPAANVSYHLTRMGVDAAPVAAVGDDFRPYGQWLSECGVDQRFILAVEGTMTARAFISTDRNQDQLIGFFPGAMAHAIRCDTGGQRADIAIVGPDDRDAMLARLRQFSAANIPILFDPGQAVSSLSGGDLLKAVKAARWMAVNEFEQGWIETKTGTRIEALAEDLEALIVTLGGRGSKLLTRRAVEYVEPARVDQPVDPTGCGDAYRAGLVAGILSRRSLADAMKMASRAAAETLEVLGAQGKLLDPSRLAPVW